MLRKVRIGNKELIKGKALICIPISGKTKTELTREMEAIDKNKADIIEWRIDALKEDFKELFTYIKLSLYNLPVLITYRRKIEGGMGEASENEYKEIIKNIIDIKADAVDIELSSGIAQEMVKYAKEKNVATVISYHNFSFTESDEEILNKIEKMKETSGDVYKLALMPETFEDTLRVLSLTKKINEEDFPTVLISMGDLGKLSRIACNQTCSPFTFASAFKGSAPGQMEAGFVKSILNEIR